jgi:hypothetical protein
MSFRQRCFAALAVGSLIACGCSNDQIPTYPVRGQVVFPDDTPGRTGVVELQSTKHKLNARGEIARDGSFVLGTYTDSDGVVAGKHKAIVVQFLATDSTLGIVHDHGDAIDRKFAAYGTSGLEFEIAETDANVLRIVVEKQPE